MADDRNRAPRNNISGNPARTMARSSTAPQRSGTDPLVELARLIGQHEGSAATSGHETVRPAARRPERARSEPPIAEPRVTETRAAAPRGPVPRASAPRTAERRPEPRPDPRIAEPAVPRAASRAPERPTGRGSEAERYADQRHDGYADPHAPDVRASRAQRSDPPAWQDPGPDLADPYHTEVGWRPPRKRMSARPDDADFLHDERAEPRGFAEQPRLPRTAARTLPAHAEARPTAAHAPVPAAAPVAPATAAAAPRAAAARAPVAPASLDDPHQAYARYAPAADGAYEAGDYYDETPRSAGGSAGYDGDAYDDGAYHYETGDYEGQQHGGGRRKVWLAASLVALAVIGTGGAYAVRSMFSDSSQSAPPPVVHADTSPKKIAAARPGDKQIQDRVGDRGVAERMMSREERPMDIKDPSPSAPLSGIRSSAEPPVVSAPATTSATESRAAAPAAGEPKRIRTVTIRPEGEPADAAPAPNASARNMPAAAPTTPATARTIPPATPATPVGAEPRTAPAAASPPPSPRARTATAAPPPPRVNPGDYMVQLSAQKSEADAKNSFRVLQSKFSSVLGGRELVVRRKDLGRRGVYYGAQVGPFASRAEAAQLCENLKAAGGSCIIERN